MLPSTRFLLLRLLLLLFQALAEPHWSARATASGPPATLVSGAPVSWPSAPDNGTDPSHVPGAHEAGQLRQWQLEQQQQQTASGHNRSSTSSGATSASSNATKIRQQQQQQQQRQPSAAPPPPPGAGLMFPLTPPPAASAPLPFALHYQPLGAGAGREPSGPQLYAQSLYSAQAPKLSYHAHAPYLKSGANNNNNNQQQQQQQQSSLCLDNNSRCANTLEAPPSAAQPTYTFHHLRPLHLAHHHLRPAGQVSGKVEQAPVKQQQTSDEFFQQLPLKTLNMTGKLIMQGADFSEAERPQVGVAHASQEQANNATQLDWSAQLELIKQIQLMLDELEESDKNKTQALVLSANEMHFELWTELYALMAQTFRTRDLIHLDLSRNSLIKLGITFTGYIEHQLMAHNGWPQLTASGQLLSGANSSTTQTGNEINSAATSNALNNSNKKNPSGRIMRHTLFLGGKLFTLIQAQRAQRQHNNNLSTQLTNNSSTTKANSSSTGTATKTHTLHPLQLPIRLRSLDLSHNKLKWLIKDQFRALKHLQVLRLDSNKIRYIHQHAFMGLEALTVLNLNFNQLQVIYIEQFQTNYNLLDLSLQSNNLAYVRGGTFASLANLRRLDLSKNKLTILSNNAFIGLESLESLNCSSNQFVHVPSASFHPLTNLKRFYLSNNLITQLAPGNFFHLPIEELWLNENDQLVSIDRGAFWDLPYLRQLHLNSNPMLMSINSQAFVGTPSLVSIETEECQSLDSSAKQMLDNITMTTTARQLRFEQQQQHLLNSPQKNNSSLSLTPIESVTPMQTNVSAPDVQNNIKNNQLANNVTKLNTIQQLPRANESQHMLTTQQTISSEHLAHKSSKIINYIYYVGTVTFLIVALKLVFKFTSTNHYLLEARRRRRRVYEANKQDMSSCSEAINTESLSSSSDRGSLSSLSGAFQMCVQPDNLIGLGVRRRQSVPLAEPQQLVAPADLPSQCDEQEEQHQDFVASLNVDAQASGAEEQVALEVGTVIRERGASACCPDCSPINQVELPALSQKASCREDAEANDATATSNESPEANEISVINHQQQQQQQQQQQHDQAAHEMTSTTSCSVGAACCPDCSQVPGSGVLLDEPQRRQQSATIDLIHSQLIAAGFDYGHANCAHFYQSLGPALQLADMTASFVNNMDYY